MKRLVLVLAVITLAIGCANSPIQPGKNPPVISLFAADNARITFSLQQTTNIHWEVLDTKATVRIDPFPGNVPTIGSASVVPTQIGVISFTLTATNRYGSSQRFVTVTVN